MTTSNSIWSPHNIQLSLRETPNKTFHHSQSACRHHKNKISQKCIWIREIKFMVTFFWSGDKHKKILLYFLFTRQRPINHAEKASTQQGLNFKWKNFFHLKFIFENGCNLFESSCLSLPRVKNIMYYVHFEGKRAEFFTLEDEKDFENWFNRHLSLGLAFKILSWRISFSSPVEI